MRVDLVGIIVICLVEIILLLWFAWISSSAWVSINDVENGTMKTREHKPEEQKVKYYYMWMVVGDDKWEVGEIVRGVIRDIRGIVEPGVKHDRSGYYWEVYSVDYESGDAPLAEGWEQGRCDAIEAVEEVLDKEGVFDEDDGGATDEQEQE
jgi:hypothetical protein